MSNQLKRCIFFKKKFLKKSLKITFKHPLSEMYLLHEKAQPLCFQYAQRQPSCPLVYRVIEERCLKFKLDKIIGLPKPYSWSKMAISLFSAYFDGHFCYYSNGSHLMHVLFCCMFFLLIVFKKRIPIFRGFFHLYEL